MIFILYLSECRAFCFVICVCKFPLALKYGVSKHYIDLYVEWIKGFCQWWLLMT